MSETSDWTLEKELCKLTGTQDFPAAFHALGIDVARDRPVSDESGWYRGGAESYLYRFCVHKADGSVEPLLIKACLGYPPSILPEKLLEMWLRRRRTLADRHVATPRLLAHGSGIVIEEYIQYSFLERLKEPSQRLGLLTQLADYARILYELRFDPIEFCRDLRSRGTDLVVVDFGQDLGDPDVQKHEDVSYLQQAFDYLKEEGYDLTRTERSAMEQAYSAIVN